MKNLIKLSLQKDCLILTIAK